MQCVFCIRSDLTLLFLPQIQERMIFATTLETLAPFQRQIKKIQDVKPATTYMVYFIGEDRISPPNRMTKTASISVRTNDNVPPEFEFKAVTNERRGGRVDLVLQLDEPGNVTFLVMSSTIDTICPSVDEVNLYQRNSQPLSLVKKSRSIFIMQ